MDNQQGNSEWVFGKLAYSIGAIFGDGSIGNYICKRGEGLQEIHVVTISNMDRECVQKVASEVNSLFDTEYFPHTFKNPNDTCMYRFLVNNRSIYTVFKYFVREKLLLPDEVFTASRDVKLSFLAGLFDTDGYVAEHAGYYRVGFGSRHRTFVEDIVRLMSKIGVQVGQIHEQTSGYGTRMYIIKPNIKSFVKAGCYFLIPRKSERLQVYIQNILKPSETIMPSPH